MMSVVLAAITTLTLAQATDSILGAQAFPSDAVVQEAPAWQRFVPVVSSGILPGTGQMMQGEWGKALIHLGFSTLCMTALQLGSNRKDPNYQLMGGLGAVAIGLWSPWEAYSRETLLHEEAPK